MWPFDYFKRRKLPKHLEQQAMEQQRQMLEFRRLANNQRSSAYSNAWGTTLAPRRGFAEARKSQSRDAEYVPTSYPVWADGSPARQSSSDRESPPYSGHGGSFGGAGASSSWSDSSCSSSSSSDSGSSCDSGSSSSSSD